ncbi:hypothetical protein CONPUDRAFT_74460 [Coniophora puteana RWD-64-598 SS2]|uniref:Uncharacterized protein n=1 Tax=Coniophora puteana (strain RWD-64-598) TaxID=741705 RepID=A0A5M3MIF1_CONPW|nr:uncharacterized protein CONPUDRAFT_74460 [Coniophora puteana RWD-64-598 SS2]EIW78873.1 hypothetical protein CONPUDRAFT_74460 [Coniophora puteana RWD-64-598 SS2]
MFNPQTVSWAQLYMTQEYIGLAAAFIIVYDYVLNITLELRYLGLAYSGVRMTQSILDEPVSGLCANFTGGYLLALFHEILLLVLTAVLQGFSLSSSARRDLTEFTGMMTIRAYVLLERPKSFLLCSFILFILVQGACIVANMVLYKNELGSSSRTEIAGLNLCNVGAPSLLYWVTPMSNSLWIAYEILLCGAVLRYAFQELPASWWKRPFRSASTLRAVITRDNLVYFFILTYELSVTISMLVSTLGATGVTANTPIVSNASPFLSAIQVAMVGPWLIISLRKRYDKDTNAEIADSYEMTTMEFSSTEYQGSGGGTRSSLTAGSF